MTQDEIISMAWEAGFEPNGSYVVLPYYSYANFKASCQLERFAALVAEPWIETNKALAKEIIELKKQAEQEPVAKEVLKYCTYFKCIDFEQTPPFLRYDTLGSTAKENFDEYCTIQECLREYGYELTDSDVDHDTVCGDVTPMPRAAPVRTKDLTDDELNKLLDYWSEDERSAYGGAWSADGEYIDMKSFARAVIAADREKNK